MKVSFKDFLFNFADVVKNLIEKYETQYKNLSGPERKERLDDAIANYAITVIDNLGFNFIFKFVLKKLLIENIPVVTQIIFNLIQAKIEGITK